MGPLIFKTKPKNIRPKAFIDAYHGALIELYSIQHPAQRKTAPGYTAGLKTFLAKTKPKPVWIFFPEKDTLVKTVNEKTYFSLRTARNKNLITKKEQQAYRNLRVGIAGLSVGSAILQALARSGGPKNLKLADFDDLEITNLNRINGSLLDIGSNKTKMASEKVWEIDPYAKIEMFDKGINKQNLEKFLLKPRLDVFIDEMDNIELKILSRQLCKKHGMPVLMATDNGDGVIVDIERYDTQPKLKLFHGRLKDKELKQTGHLAFEAWIKLANKIIGEDFLTNRMKASLRDIGKKIPSIPQLGSSASMAGSVISLLLRKISASQPLPSGRLVFDLEKKLYGTRT